MAVYGITFRHDGETIAKTAGWYEIRDGFLRLYHDLNGFTEEFASFASDDILQIVLQNEYSEEEVLNQIKGAVSKAGKFLNLLAKETTNKSQHGLAPLMKVFFNTKIRAGAKIAYSKKRGKEFEQ